MKVAERKSFLLRIDGNVLDSLRKWADDELRSLNGQIEFVLRDALRRRGRLRAEDDAPPDAEPPLPQPQPPHEPGP
jgi:hypothetical protein